MRTLLLLCTLLVSSMLMAQRDGDNQAIYPEKGDSEIGINLAFNSSFLTEDGFTETDDSDSRNGIGLGVHYNYYLGRNWSIKTQLNWDPKGFSALGIDVNMNYITLPVMASWHFGKKRRWYLQGGIYAAVLTSANIEGVDVKDQFESTDFGTAFGIGIKIPIGGQMFYIESDGQNSFSDPSVEAENSDLILSRTTLSIGILF